MVTDLRREAIQFTFTSKVRGSQITATGVMKGENAKGFNAAVTGGTGAYFGAAGEVHVGFTSDNSSLAIYHLQK